MAIATILSHFLYRAIIVMMDLYALVVEAAFIAICNTVKWTPTVLSSLWAVTIPVLPVVYRFVSSLWMCMSCTYSILYRVSGTVIYVSRNFAIPTLCPVLRNLWMLLSYNWKVTLVVWFFASILINLTDDFDKFDERIARIISEHTALIRQRRRPDPEEQADVDDDTETLAPTGAYDYSKAYQLDFSVETYIEE
jgi:hypothetical protein